MATDDSMLRDLAAALDPSSAGAPQTLRLTTAGRSACSPRQLVAGMPGSERKVKR
jgi:hypothetical protein